MGNHWNSIHHRQINPPSQTRSSDHLISSSHQQQIHLSYQHNQPNPQSTRFCPSPRTPIRSAISPPTSSGSETGEAPPLLPKMPAQRKRVNAPSAERVTGTGGEKKYGFPGRRRRSATTSPPATPRREEGQSPAESGAYIVGRARPAEGSLSQASAIYSTNGECGPGLSAFSWRARLARHPPRPPSSAVGTQRHRRLSFAVQGFHLVGRVLLAVLPYYPPLFAYTYLRLCTSFSLASPTTEHQFQHNLVE